MTWRQLEQLIKEMPEEYKDIETHFDLRTNEEEGRIISETFDIDNKAGYYLIIGDAS